MTKSLIDEIAEELHSIWWRQQLQAGVTLGPRNEKEKTHPHMIPWSAKTEQERGQDRYQAVRAIVELRTTETTEERIAEVIHAAIREHRLAETGEIPDYLANSWNACKRSEGEKRQQAKAILEIWTKRCREVHE